MPVSLLLSALGPFLVNTASGILALVIGKKITEKPNSNHLLTRFELETMDDRLRQIKIEYLRGRDQREQTWVDVQTDLAKVRKAEAQFKVKVAQGQAEREEYALELQAQRLQLEKEKTEQFTILSEKALEYKQQDILLKSQQLSLNSDLTNAQKQHMHQDIQLRQRQLTVWAEEKKAKHQLGLIYLELTKNRVATDIQLKLSELQASWDNNNWTGVLSREETRDILIGGQKKHRVLLLVAPPNIEDCPEFNAHLEKELRSEFKDFMQRNYPITDSSCPVEFYGKFFKSSVFDLEVRQLERDLQPIPTIVIYSDITDQKVYFHVSFWGLANSVSLHTSAWNWAAEKERILATGKSDTESNQLIRNIIVRMHQLLAAFLVDLYYLGVNPVHEPRLFQLEEIDLPPDWVQEHFNQLREIQAALREELNYTTRFKR